MRKQYYNQTHIDKVKRWAEFFQNYEGSTEELLEHTNSILQEVENLIGLYMKFYIQLSKKQHHQSVTYINSILKYMDYDLERIDRGERYKKLYEENLAKTTK